MTQPSCFISYSWDSDPHKQWVASLASRLVQNGVRVWLDQWHLKPGDSITQFMERKIRSSRYIVVVCTPSYARKSDARRGGVGYEQQIIASDKLAGIPNRRIIPILRAGDHTRGRNFAFPTHLADTYAVDARSKRLSNSTFEELLDAIFNRSPQEPPSPKEGILIRPPTMENEGFVLLSEANSNKKRGKTTPIPTERQRARLRESHQAQLLFEIDDRRDRRTYRERLWVSVLGKVGAHYLGSFLEEPITQSPKLRFNVWFAFLPEHVMAIRPAKSSLSSKGPDTRIAS
ncbi:hypothetical protein M2171_000679 [Bradyrhizobium japonicum USDA 38]|uniref:toll/interleukin-1 receptor domain-containing protein n=1 Tax=Bradyrhizobium japonicum TaxID=375 RepID=UPI0006760B30|nr:toll/interleukin-1 receptor domain-containing protein [Bradyrhizobium japonicum]MCS3891546.1 hypothetical protein [Bradyrhizobium japonicum USDA 38]MCS3944062.1 hypothetical protein [Bradyrhizobium japonicum]MCW2223241.1 hypothetical protein [Bradyrhizobium japonicum]MCW2347853.1 hypothetical protein [Bradyrhizobium japonicum]